MAEKTEQTNTINETGVTEENYASILNESLKSKDAELRAHKETSARTIKELTEMIVNGRPGVDDQQTKSAPTDEEIDNIRKKLFNTENELSNLEYVENALKLRDAILERDGVDIFVGRGSNFEPTQDDYYRAENTAQIYKECVEYAQGDSEVFTTELMRRTKR